MKRRETLLTSGGLRMFKMAFEGEVLSLKEAWMNI
jgi:hypothetical protein